MKYQIIVQLTVEGIHCWPECPYDDVAFLRSPHRHIFHIRCKRVVKHNDRDVEIIRFKREIQEYLQKRFVNEFNVCDFGSMSCEQIASLLVETFDLLECEVLEDGENGAVAIP